MHNFALKALHSPRQDPATSARSRVDLMTDYLEATFAMLAREGVSARMSLGLEDWLAEIRDAPGSVGVNPTFDSSIQRIDPADSFAIILSVDGRTAALMACRRFRTDSYYDLVSSGRVWYADPEFSPLPLRQSGAGPSGTVSHTGGLWVHPDHRGIGLSWILPRMIGATAVALWGIDWHTGMVFAKLNQTQISQKNYGSTDNRVLIEGYFPPTGRIERIFSNETPVADIVERTRRDLVQIRGNRNQKVRDLAPIANKRADQAPVLPHASRKEAV